MPRPLRHVIYRFNDSNDCDGHDGLLCNAMIYTTRD
jgi:hypothetical protein